MIEHTQVDAGLEVKLATDRRGADVVIEYSGNMHAMQAALRGVAFGGTVVSGAFPPAYSAGFDIGAEAHLNRPNIIFSRACSDPIAITLAGMRNGYWRIADGCFVKAS